MRLWCARQLILPSSLRGRISLEELHVAGRPRAAAGARLRQATRLLNRPSKLKAPRSRRTAIRGRPAPYAGRQRAVHGRRLRRPFPFFFF